LFDQFGNEFVSRFDVFRSDERCEATLLEPVETQNSRNTNLSIAQAIPQDRKMDQIVQKAAELGVAELIPLVTERTIVRVSEERKNKVATRWNRIAQQTLQQSRLTRLPQIQPIHSFQSLCKKLTAYSEVYILDPSQEARPVCDLVQKQGKNKKGKRLLLLIGPEGGFTNEEIKDAEACGAQCVRLGRGVLKTDTAFIAAVSVFQTLFIHE